MKSHIIASILFVISSHLAYGSDGICEADYQDQTAFIDDFWDYSDHHLFGSLARTGQEGPCAVSGETVAEDVGEFDREQMEDIVEKIQEENLTMPLALSDEEFASCKLYPHCEDGSNPNWAAMQIGADLADKIVDKHLRRYREQKSSVAATVAVLDTGFDTSNGGVDINGIPVALDALSVTIEKASDATGEAENDIDGHGTPVAGVIAGRGVGISRYLNLKLYRITKPNAIRTVNWETLNNAIKKACRTADIVNVSWGSYSDQLGSVDVRREKWYKTAEQKGCLVVKSAGNGGVRGAQKRIDYPIETPFSTVSASNKFQSEGSSSTTGMIKAPGVGVYTILSTKHDYNSPTNDHTCNMNNLLMGLIDGTSFAASISSGVKGQILTILNARKIVPHDPQKKVALIKSIELASAKWGELTGSGNGVVNALGAAIIAENINKSNMTNNLHALVNIGKRAVREKCSEAHKSCRQQRSCSDVKTCMDELRFKSLVCVPPQEETHRNLLVASTGLLEGEMSKNLIMKNARVLELEKESRRHRPRGQIRQESPSPHNEYLLVMETQWDKIAFGREDNSLYEAVEILLAAGKLGIGGFVSRDKLEKMIFSQDFDVLFDIYDAIGESAIKGGDEEVMMKFVSAFGLLSPGDQIVLINRVPDITADIGNNTSELGLLYVLNYQKGYLRSDVRDALEKKIISLGYKWLDGNLNAAPNNFSIALNAGKNIPIYDMLFKALYDEARFDPLKDNPVDVVLEKIKNGILTSNNMYLYGYVIMSELSLIPMEKKLEISCLVVERDMDDHRGEGMAKAERLEREYKRIYGLYEKESDRDRRGVLYKQQEDAIVALMKWVEEHYNSVEMQNMALGFLLKRGTAEDVEKAKRFLLQSFHAKLPLGGLTYAAYNEQRDMRMGLMQNRMFLNDFLKINLQRSVRDLGPVNNQDRVNYFFKRPAKKTSRRNVARLIESSAYLGEDNVRNVLQDNEREFGSFISTMANEQVREDGYESLIGRFLDVYKTINDMGVGDTLRSNLLLVKEDMLNNPRKYSQTFRQKLRKLYGLGEES